MNRCISGKPVWRSGAFSVEMLLAVPVWFTLLRRPWVAADVPDDVTGPEAQEVI
jgi:hypothetical protein